jgi:hypothetical protein
MSLLFLVELSLLFKSDSVFKIDDIMYRCLIMMTKTNFASGPKAEIKSAVAHQTKQSTFSKDDERHFFLFPYFSGVVSTRFW